MKVYAIKASGAYCGGMAVVAAPDAESACKLADAIDTFPWSIQYGKSDKVTELELDAPNAGVLAHFEMGE